MLIAVVNVFSESTYSQDVNVSLSLKNSSLIDVFNAIQEQTEFDLFYKNEQVLNEKNINVNFKDKKVNEVLGKVLENTGLQYKIIDRDIVITKYKVEKKTVKGVVTDNKGESLPGASVMVKGTGNGVVTDESGKYEIVCAVENPVLIFSFTGMKSQEVPLNNRSVVNVTLESGMTDLNEVVVVGYGTQRKSDVTGAVSSIQSKDFVKGVTSSALQLLNGKASGVHISQSSSAPGGGVSIKVRGSGSINSSNSVLIVIDGMPVSTTSSLNPDDIESIEILKDASSAAIYGTRAANGVVLITTKRGKKGRPEVSFNSYIAYQTVASKLDLLNAQEYMTLLNDLSTEAGNAAIFTQDEMNKIGSGTNWQDEVFRNAWAKNNQFSISGGSDYSNYYISLSYLDQDGVMISSGIEKYNARINYELKPNDRMKFGFNFNAHRSITDKVYSSNSANEYAGVLNAAIQFDPTLSTGLDDDGRYHNNPTIALENPLAMAEGIDQESLYTRLYGSVYGEIEWIKNLKTKLRVGTDLSNSRGDNYYSRLTKRGQASGGSASVSTSEYTYWITELLTTYAYKINDYHKFDVMGGITWEEFTTRGLGANGQGFLSDVTLTNLLQSGDREKNTINSSKYVNKLNSYIARVNYNVLDRYMLTASLRIDGTSRFSDENKYATFPSAAFAWRISEEDFLKENKYIDNLKFRLGYGKLGNQGINNFETIQTFISGNSTVLGQSVQQGAKPARIPNQELVWETSEEYNIGVDYALLNNRISGSIEVYSRYTKDQLFNKPVPMTTGFGSVRVNIGEVRNQGIDFSLNSVNFDNGEFKWRSGITLSLLENEVVELPEFTPKIVSGNIGTFTSGYTLVEEGQPMRAFYGYKVLGIFQEGDDIANSAQPAAKPGHPIFYDKNDDGKINSDDKVVLGKPFADVTWSLNNTISYKNFDLEMFFVGVHGIETLNNNAVESLYPINFRRNRIAKYYDDRWTKDNTGAKYPSGVNPSSYGGGKAVNSLTIQDASFIRLKNITLNYNVPLRNKNIISQLSFYVSCENVITITDYDGYDPDGNSSGTGVVKTSYNNYPLARTFRVGTSIKF